MTSPAPLAVEPFIDRRGQGTPVLFIHGNGVDHRLLLPLDHIFEEGSWERVYLDLPGFGSTPALDAPGGLPEIAEWLRAVVRREFGAGTPDAVPFALVANSLGGALARDLMAEFPELVLGALLLAPVVDPRPNHRDLTEFSVADRDDPFCSTLPDEDSEDFFQMFAIQTPESWRRYTEAALPGIRAADPEAMHLLRHRYILPDVPEERGTLPTTPVTVLVGRQDQIVGFRDQLLLAQRYERGTYVLVAGAGHNVHLDQPGLVYRVADAWKNTLEASSAEVLGNDPVVR
jgi:pimeloyl-ACP methyl ester carboxylesterase